jgi:voltage-gated potassium channel
MLAASNIQRLLRQPTMLLDIVILATLLAPGWLDNFGFLRILRLWTLSKRGVIWQQWRRTRFRDREDAARAVINLTTFLFVVTGFIYSFFFTGRPGIEGYVDAFYFTVTTMTTTGFGDITLPGTAGKLTSIAVMIIGISLFVRLAQAIFRPAKVTYPCPRCGLQRHEPDAVHCKACGQILCIPDPD